MFFTNNRCTWNGNQIVDIRSCDLTIVISGYLIVFLKNKVPLKDMYNILVLYAILGPKLQYTPFWNLIKYT